MVGKMAVTVSQGEYRTRKYSLVRQYRAKESGPRKLRKVSVTVSEGGRVGRNTEPASQPASKPR